MDKEIGKQ